MPKRDQMNQATNSMVSMTSGVGGECTPYGPMRDQVVCRKPAENRHSPIGRGDGAIVHTVCKTMSYSPCTVPITLNINGILHPHCVSAMQVG